MFALFHSCHVLVIDRYNHALSENKGRVVKGARHTDRRKYDLFSFLSVQNANLRPTSCTARFFSTPGVELYYTYFTDVFIGTWLSYYGTFTAKQIEEVTCLLNPWSVYIYFAT